MFETDPEDRVLTRLTNFRYVVACLFVVFLHPIAQAHAQNHDVSMEQLMAFCRGKGTIRQLPNGRWYCVPNRAFLARMRAQEREACRRLEKQSQLTPELRKSCARVLQGHEKETTAKTQRQRERLAAQERERERLVREAERLAKEKERLAKIEREQAAARESKQQDVNNIGAVALGRRVALVIGNSGYQSVAKLPNPARDASTIAVTLRHLGFAEVTLLHDLSKQAMERTLIDFADRARSADWAVIYYAGHGMEMGGQNYLIPIDARLKQDRHVQLETVSLGAVLEAAGAAKTLRLIILDACRNNPFLGRMTRTVATRSIGRGLAEIEPTGGVLVAYAARHGQVALDGDGRNSPFVEALEKHLGEPGVDIRLMFAKVRDDVMAATNNAQQPFTYGSLPGVTLSFRPVQ